MYKYRPALRRMFCILLCLTAAVVAVSAHPGHTDRNGGHYDRSTGEYHYHHGYPAHQHTNGYCPYAFQDKTDHSYHSSNSTVDSGHHSSSSASSTDSVPPSLLTGLKETAESHNDDESILQLSGRVLLTLMIVCWPIPFWILLSIKHWLVDVHAERLRKRGLETKHTQFLASYGNRSLCDIIPPPTVGDHIGADGLPCGDGPENWGTAYTVFITSRKSQVFHKHRICGKNVGRPINIAKNGGRRPCSRCYRSGPPPDLEWYYSQRALLRESSKYGLHIFPEKYI